MRRILVLVILAMLAACGAPPPTADLLIPVNAKCTTCEDFIRCDGGSANAAVYDPTFDLYRLEPKSVLAQIATVWHFLIQLFYTRTEDFRPLTVYAQRPGDSQAFSRTANKAGEARTDLVENRIYLPEGWIDQVNGEWHGADGSLRGACRVLKPAEGRELLKLFPEPAKGDAS